MGQFVDTASAKQVDASCVEAALGPAFSIGIFAPEHKASQGETSSTYEGSGDFGPTKLTLGLHVYKSADSKYFAVLDSPDQHLNNIGVDVFTVNNSSVHFEIAFLFAKFDGSISADGSVISGNWIQGGSPIHFDLKRKAE